MFAKPKQAAVVLRRWAVPWASRCNAKGANTQVGVVQSVTPFHPDAPGTQAYGYRISTKASGHRGYAEIIFLRADARLSVFLWVSTHPIAYGVERRLTRLVARRMTAGLA